MMRIYKLLDRSILPVAGEGILREVIGSDAESLSLMTAAAGVSIMMPSST